MASPVAPVATLFGSTGGVSASGRPATKTAGQRRNVVDDDDAAAYQVADETVESEEKRRETETEARRDALFALRRLVKEVDADAWKYSKPRHAMR